MSEVNHINACFLSYRNTRDALAETYIDEFENILNSQLALLGSGLKVWRYRTEIKPGEAKIRETEYQLCKSACMLMLFSPCYFDLSNPVCALEYKGMIELEERRLQSLKADDIKGFRNKRLIIPIFFRGREYLPQEIIDFCHLFYSDFSNVLIPKDLRNRSWREKISVIADEIYKRYCAVVNSRIFSECDCNDFHFAQVEELTEWIGKFAPVKKLIMPGR